MHIISHTRLSEFYKIQPEAKNAIEKWYKTVSKSKWKCFADIKNDFSTVDNVGNQRYVFNIKGNNYRIIALIKFQIQVVYIRFVGTHSQYDKIKNIQNS